MSRCLPSEMSIASFWPSGENRGFAQSAFAARSGDVLPSRVIQSIGVRHATAPTAGHVDQRAVGRERPLAHRRQLVIRRDALNRRHRLADRLEAIEIEAHREERALLHVDQMPAFASLRRGKAASRSVRRRRHVASVVRAAHRRSSARRRRAARRRGWRRRNRPGTGARCTARALPPGSACGQRWVDRALAERAEHRRRAAGGRDAHEPRVRARPLGVKMIVSSSVQVPPRPAWRVTQLDRRAAGDRDLLQLAAGEERDPLAVRREERAGRILGAGKRRGLQLIELPDEELRPGLPVGLRDKRQRRPVRRQDRRRAKSGRRATRRRRCWRAACAASARASCATAPTGRSQTSAAPSPSAANAHGSARRQSGSGRRGARCGRRRHRDIGIERRGILEDRAALRRSSSGAASDLSRGSAAATRRSGAGRSAGSASQRTSSLSTLASVIEMSSPSNARRPVSIS